MKYNKLLTNEDRKYYGQLIEKMFELCPESMAKKYVEANVQQATVLDMIGEELKKKPNSEILCVGSFEDTVSECLGRLGIDIENIDSDINIDLHTFKETCKHLFDIIFSVSVIEHVKDDEQFLRDMCSLLKPDGMGIITCDFNDYYKPGDKVIYPDERFYTKNDLEVRLREILKEYNCELVDDPLWKGEPDFTLMDYTHTNFIYSFATFVFRKESSTDTR
jgi:SAM-dependent methyltransferase